MQGFGNEEEEVEVLTAEEHVFPSAPGGSRGASFGAGFTARTGDTETETRFLVVDPAVTNVTYTEEGKMRKPRSDTVKLVHNAGVDADPEGALKLKRAKINAWQMNS